jgi:hypothetical protein
MSLNRLTWMASQAGQLIVLESREVIDHYRRVSARVAPLKVFVGPLRPRPRDGFGYLLRPAVSGGAGAFRCH